MPRNKRGGKKHKKGKNSSLEEDDKKPIQYAQRGQAYAIVNKKLGGSHIEVNCSDNKIRKAIIPGKFRKRVWMNIGDVILISVDSIGRNNMCSIDYKYNNREIDILRKKGLLNFNNNSKGKIVEFEKESNIEIEEKTDDLIHKGYDLPPEYSDEYYDDDYKEKEDEDEDEDLLDFEEFDIKNEDVNIDDL